MYGLTAYTADQVEHFLTHGYVVIKHAFSRAQAAEFTREMWVRLGMDPHDPATWTQERVHMPVTKRVRVSEFAPKVRRRPSSRPRARSSPARAAAR